MTWVKRHDAAPVHTCTPPMRQVTYTLPAEITSTRYPITHHVSEVDGDLGDLWRCDQCGRLWRVGDACDACDWYGDSRPHPGMCTLGLRWRPATLWQRLRHRRPR